MECYIIEFTGLPGCGKSTLSGVLAEHYVNQGYNVLTESDIFSKKHVVEKLYELVCSFLNIRYFKLNILLIKVGIAFSIRTRSLFPLLKTFKIIRYNELLFRSIQLKNVEFIIMSEGYIQFIANLLDRVQYNENKTVRKIISQIKLLNKKLLVVDCNIDIESSITRVNRRKSTPNNVDLMNARELKEFMNCRNNNNKELKKSYHSLLNTTTLDMHKTLEENLEELLLTLKIRVFNYEN